MEDPNLQLVVALISLTILFYNIRFVLQILGLTHYKYISSNLCFEVF